ncbi:MAG: hypothetical protein L0H84_09520 [Pseudonocardia sp.]|nr:hypothetical protein [Pseudonocardia sp.]
MVRSRTAVVAALCVLGGSVLLGCGRPPEQAPVPPADRGVVVPVAVLELRADADGRGPVAALTTQPVALRVFAGWFGRAEADDSDAFPVAPEPGRTLLAVADSTGCRLATGVEVRRVGDDLRFRFTGGTESATCVRALGPVALLSVATADIEGVRTVNGRAPVAASGPGLLTGFFRLQGGNGGAAELGTPGARAVAASLGSRNGAAAAALNRPAPPGTRGFAFVLPGCRATGAVLLLGVDRISAEVTGGDGVTCYVPEYSLAIFTVPADLVPARAVLGP